MTASVNAEWAPLSALALIRKRIEDAAIQWETTDLNVALLLQEIHELTERVPL